MLEPLRVIPGPEFLMYYAGAIVAAWFIVRSMAYADGSLAHMPPQLTRVDPYSIAALRGGAPEAMKVAVYDLEQQGLLKLSGEGVDISMKTLGDAREVTNPIARDVYGFISGHEKPRELFNDTSMLGKVESHLAPSYAEMKMRHLIRDDDMHVRVWRMFFTWLLLFWAVGGAKLYLGVVNNKPVVFLVILLLAVPAALWLAAWPMDRLTALGRRHLADLKSHFAWVKSSMNNNRDVDTTNMAFALAVFGAGALSAGVLYDLYNKAAIPPNQSSSSSGCGGGCSGCGGGCGGCGGCG